MTTETMSRTGLQPETATYDALIIGAGLAGVYMLHKMRELGFSARVVEMGDGVGGTWYWNRYPGARCDVESIEYSYSFSREIEQEWDWTEAMPAQPEIERYVNFVTDRLGLRDGIQFETKVTAAHFNEATNRWLVETDRGDRYDAQYVVAATGCLSAPLTPEIKGMDSFKGITLFTNQFPKEGFDFTGLRTAVIGTGSSGVQSIPVVASQAKHTYVFQRSAAYTRPANNRPLNPGEMAEAKANYEKIRAEQRATAAGVLRFGALPFVQAPPTQRILETPMEERLKKIDELGWGAPQAWADIMSSIEANRAGTQLYGEILKRELGDEDLAARLTPDYPLGCKRGIIDTDYFETFKKPNVTLVDLRRGGITEVTETGVQTEQGFFEVDVILYATGFDAMTGALNRIDIRGRDGESLKAYWEQEGPKTYLGLQIAGFPNLFTITGPGSPSVLANMVMCIEQHVEWIARCMETMRADGDATIEANPDAQEEWVEHVASLVEGGIRVNEACNSWYLGANIPGKRRVYMPYSGGLNVYRKKCDDVADAGYEGFTLTKAAVAVP